MPPLYLQSDVSGITRSPLSDVTLVAYSDNVAEGKDIILTCLHSVPDLLADPVLRWAYSDGKTGSEAVLTGTLGKGWFVVIFVILKDWDNY